MKLLFDRSGGASNASQIHADDCAMLNRAKSNNKGRYILCDMSEVEDLKERGFKVTYCKCTKSLGDDEPTLVPKGE